MNVDVSLGSRSYRIVVASGALATVGPRPRELSVWARAAPDDGAGPGRRFHRRQDGDRPPPGKEPHRRIPPAAARPRRSGRRADPARARVSLRACRDRQARNRAGGGVLRGARARRGAASGPRARRARADHRRVMPPQGLRRRARRTRGRAASRTQLRPHHRPRPRGRYGVRALHPRRGGLAGHRRGGAPRAAARRRRRRDGRAAGTAAGRARPPRPYRRDRRGARRGGDRPRQEGEGRSRPLRAGAQDRRVPSGLRRPGRRRPRGHRVSRIVTPEVGLTTQTSDPYNRLAMPVNDQAIIGAIRRQEERLARDPASLAFAQLADLYRKAGRIRDAVALCHDGLARYPHYTTARLILAKALAADEQLAAALVELNAILEVSPKDLPCHPLAAKVHRRLGHIDEAVKHLEAAADLDPGDRESRALLLLLRAAAPPSGEAAGLARLLRDDTFATVTFGSLCLEQGCVEEAVQVFTRILRKDPDLREARDRLESALRARQRRN